MMAEGRPPRSAYEYEKRSFVFRGAATTIAMELFYWAAVDRIAKLHRVKWRGLVTMALGNKPSIYKSRAGWLRFYITGYGFLGPRREQRELPLYMALMPKEGWSLRKLKEAISK